MATNASGRQTLIDLGLWTDTLEKKYQSARSKETQQSSPSPTTTTNRTTYSSSPSPSQSPSYSKPTPKPVQQQPKPVQPSPSTGVPKTTTAAPPSPSSGLADFKNKYAQYGNQYDLDKQYSNPTNDFLGAINGTDAETFQDVFNKLDYAVRNGQQQTGSDNYKQLMDQIKANSGNFSAVSNQLNDFYSQFENFQKQFTSFQNDYKNKDSYKDFMNNYSKYADQFNLEEQYSNPSDEFLAKINGTTKEQFQKTFNELDQLVRSQNQEQYQKFQQELSSMSGDYASQFEKVQAALQAANQNYGELGNQFGDFTGQFDQFRNNSNQRYDEIMGSISDLQDLYKRATEPIDFSQFKTELATIEDIAKKYGFDYSKDYAKRQAELERQQKQSAIDTQKKAVDNSIVSSSQGLDHDYFQRYMSQAQGQANSGLNGGIASDQNLRLAMSRQNAMGDVYRDANLQNFQLGQAEGRLGAEELARADQLYNDRRQQGFQNVLQEGQFDQRQNLAALQAELARRGQDVDMSQYLNSFNNLSAGQQQQQSNWQDQFDWSKYMDQTNNQYRQDQSEWQRQYQTGNQEWQRMMDMINNNYRQEQADWSRYTDTWDREHRDSQAQFQNSLATAKFNRPYEQLTAYEQQQLAQSQQRIAQGYAQMQQSADQFARSLANSNDKFDQEMAMKFYEMEGMLELAGYSKEESNQLAGDVIFGGGRSTPERLTQ